MAVSAKVLDNDNIFIEIDQEGATWLADEADDLFHKTNDYGWKELADEIRPLLLPDDEDDPDEGGA